MITQFTIGFSRTINLGNFQSCRIEASVTYAIPEDADGKSFVGFREQAQIELRTLLEETYLAQFKDRQKTSQSTTEGGDYP